MDVFNSKPSCSSRPSKKAKNDPAAVHVNDATPPPPLAPEASTLPATTKLAVSSTLATAALTKQHTEIPVTIPLGGMPPKLVYEHMIKILKEDFDKVQYNVASYINIGSGATATTTATTTTTIQDDDDDDKTIIANLAILGLQVNIAETAVYKATTQIQNSLIEMIAKLWHCPSPLSSLSTTTNKPRTHQFYSGTSTIGSTEACILAGIALKKRWREWYKANYRCSELNVQGIVPNIIISSCYQSAWEKFFRFFDVEPRIVQPSLLNDRMRMPSTRVAALCDEKTIGVVGILGNHYNGACDSITDIDEVVQGVNNKYGYQIGIHVDAASGGFVEPFLSDTAQRHPNHNGHWDFRCKNVLSINTSGHKFGESTCGIGWIIFRHHKGLGDGIVTDLAYLGGPSCESMSLNFSRPATSLYAQYYHMLRLGFDGYKSKLERQMDIASMIRDHLQQMKISIPSNSNTATLCQLHDQGLRQPNINIDYGEEEPHDAGNAAYLFEIVDSGDLPVVAARLNPNLDLPINDIDLQHELGKYGWFIPAYPLGFMDHSACDSPKDGMVHRPLPRWNRLCTDADERVSTMFRIVIKSHFTYKMAQDFIVVLNDVLEASNLLSALEGGGL